MKETEEKHWTGNSELIERYVLNRLGAEERNELEDHLRVCELCKLAVRSEQVLVAGIRRSGREQFKIALRKRIISIPENETPWMQILSAAAGVILLLAIGFYNHWFEILTSKQSNNTVSTSPQQEMKPTESVPEHQLSDHNQPATQGNATDLKTSPKISRAESRSEEQLSKHSPISDDLARHSETATIPAPRVSPNMNSNVAEEARRSALATGMADAGAQASTSESGSLWVEGTIVSDEVHGIRDKEVAPPIAKEIDALRTSETRVSKKSAYAPRTEGKQTQSYDLRSFSLAQQLSTALPSTQLKLQYPGSAGIVMTRIQQSDAKTELTLYLDSLVDEKELSHASIEMPRNDSLILRFSNQRIDYKLPAGWNTQSKPSK